MFDGEFARRQVILIEVVRVDPALPLVEEEHPGRALHFKIIARPHTVNEAVVLKQNVPAVFLVGDIIVDRLELLAVRASLLIEHDHSWYRTIILACMKVKIIVESVCIEYSHVLRDIAILV